MNDNLQDELGRTLRQQADRVGGDPISFDAVRGTAGRIRNRRRAMAAGAVLAVGAAIVAPTAIMGGFGEDRGTPPVVTDPTPTPTGDATARTPEGLTITGLERGGAPQVAWLEGGTLHVGSETVELPVDEQVQDVVVLDDVWVLRGFSPQGSGSDAAVYVVDRDTDEVLHQELSHHTPLVVNAAGTAAAWMSEDGIPRVWQSGRSVPVDYEKSGSGSNHQAVALTGERCDAGAESVEGAGCTVFFTQEETSGGGAWTVSSWAASSHGTVDPATERIKALSDVSTDAERLIGITEYRMDSTCSALTRRQGDIADWSTCDHALDEFSPDGRFVLAGPTWRSGAGDGSLAVFDAESGDAVLERDNRDSQSWYTAAAWEDDEHVLVSLSEKGRWAIVRIGVDGSMELATEIRKGQGEGSPFFLETRP